MTPESKKLTITIQELRERLRGKKDIYRALSKKFYLPDFGSKALTDEYLAKYLVAGPSILKLERSKMNFIVLPKLPGKVNIDNMITKFGDYLRSKHLPQLGFEEGYNPDLEWLLRAVTYLDPQG